LSDGSSSDPTALEEAVCQEHICLAACHWLNRSTKVAGQPSGIAEPTLFVQMERHNAENQPPTDSNPRPSHVFRASDVMSRLQIPEARVRALVQSQGA
jgi:hypothetical protein